MRIRWTRTKNAIVLALIVVVLTPVIVIEALYYRGLSALPNDPYPKQKNHSQLLLDGEWVAHGGEGDIEMHEVTPLAFVTGFFYSAYTYSPDHRVKALGESQSLVSVSTRILILKNKKNIERVNTLERHLQDASVSIWISNHWDARNALNYVLDNGYFGRGCLGIDAAANHYFRKKSKNLTIEEAILFVGVSKAPGRYDPVLYPDNALERANYLAERLTKNWPERYGDLKKIKKMPDTLVKTAQRCS